MNVPGQKIAVIFLQPACNMTCTFCITEDRFRAASFGELKTLLIGLKREGFNNVVFGGGEPFIWPGDLTALTAEAKRLGLFVQVGSNMIAAPDGFETIPTIDRFVLPLESVDPAVHNRMRLYKRQHHAIILDRLARLQKAGKSTTVSTVVTKVNYQGVRELGEFLKNLNQPKPFIHAWHLYMFLPQGRGGAPNASALYIEEEAYEAAVSSARIAAGNFAVYKRKNMYASKAVDFFWLEQGRVRRGSEFRAAPLRSSTCALRTLPYSKGTGCGL
jgi:MoaA/NifB/PqqE/SkfB family radical SAM enzyme